MSERSVLYHQELRKAVVLNPTGSWVWGLLEQPLEERELVGQMQARYPKTPPDQVETDLRTYLQHLVEQGVLQQQ